MQDTRLIMGMPVTASLIDPEAKSADLESVFAYFSYIDEKFSPYKPASEVSKINDGLLSVSNASEDMRQVLTLCEETKIITKGYFDIYHLGRLDPSGLVKGWAILNAAKLLEKRGLTNFYLNVGGDIQTKGKNSDGDKWRIGIENPFNRKEIIKAVVVDGEGVATSGTYLRGQHIYDPHRPEKPISEIISLSVIGPNIYEADRFATAAFAMGKKALDFISGLKGFAGYMIDPRGQARFTSNFSDYVYI